MAAVPQFLLGQLKPGGRLVAIVGQEPVMQAMLFTRAAASQFKHEALFDTLAPRLQGFAEPTAFRF